MEPKGGRHRHIASGGDRCGDGQASVVEPYSHLEQVGKWEGRHQRGLRPEVETGTEHGRVAVSTCIGDLPVRARGQEAVDGQAIRIEPDRRDGWVEQYLVPRHLVAQARQPVCPRVQQRDAEGGTPLNVGGKPAALAEQLLTPVAQRAAHHARARGIRGCQIPTRRRESRGGVPVGRGVGDRGGHAVPTGSRAVLPQARHAIRARAARPPTCRRGCPWSPGRRRPRRPPRRSRCPAG